IINAKKIKINKKLLKFNKFTQKTPKYLEKYILKIKNKYNLDEKIIIKALNGIFDELNSEQINYIKNQYIDIIQDRYRYIDELLREVVITRQNYIYGYSKLDKILLNPIVMMIGFSLIFLLSIYLIFFLVGAWLSDGLSVIYEKILVQPFMNVILSITDNVWLIEFFQNGVFASIGSVLGFLPQVCLLFVFLTILEDSGLISRMAYVFDDFLSVFGLNGKALYIMLMGLGCNSMSTMASRNMGEKNMRIKSAILNPYISCMARLPVYMVIASAFFGVKSYLVIVGLYLLGLIISLFMSLVITKTMLPINDNNILLEFPPLKSIDIKHVLSVAKQNAIDMTKRIFGIVLCVGIIVWILTHTGFDLRFTQIMTDSILFVIADKISGIFAPIGLNSAGVVSALIVGIMAKELIISTMSICNNVTTNSALSMSLISASSVVSFSSPSAISFLIFTLLYCPCISNIAVLKKETDKFFMWFSIISQFTVAYIMSFIVYQSIVNGIIFTLIIISVIALIFLAGMLIYRKLKKDKCLLCGKCK
ncbi:MAG: nucleoside recognition domain-containing protein, partial [Clostridia bacterium]